MKIEVLGLKRFFGTTKAVDGMTFSFESGQIMGFVGPNGAGKTTTMRIMATLDEPTSGDVRFDGFSVIQYPEKARRALGYMPDSLPGHKDITVHEYLDFFARSFGIRGERRRQVVQSVEEFTNLVNIRDKWIFALSKGMKQRVSLARALVHDPPLLIMDEPAAGLDPRARVELRELLTILAGQGKAIFISSHILRELEEFCTGAVIVEQGKLLRAGSMHEITHVNRAHRTMRMRARAEKEELLRTVMELPSVLEARIIGQEVEVDLQGDDEAVADFLNNLLQRGQRIVEFRHERADLEDVFMTVTQGKVQ